MISPYAKFYITLIGVAVTSALALIPPTTSLWVVLTILSGLVTAALTYQVPNAPLQAKVAPPTPAGTPFGEHGRGAVAYFDEISPENPAA